MSVSRTDSIKIDEDEYIAIVKRRIREDLRRYLGTGNVVIPNKEGGMVNITVDEIEVPSWRFGFPPDEGIGQGSGEPGTDLGPAGPEEGDEKGEGAGEDHGNRSLVIDINPEEFAQYFEEDLELPRIKPKGDRTIYEEKERYSTLSKKGPHSMIQLRKTILEALKRSIAEGTFKPPDKTAIVPKNSDLWFKSFELIKEPKNNAVVFFMRDVSGSMGSEERRVVSYLCDLCEFWLARNYNRLEKVYIVHDDRAEEVPRERFFNEDWGGGTICSSALTKMHQIIDERFPVSQWNIYPIYLSDGFNFSSDDETFLDIMGAKTLPIVNQFSYGQIDLVRPWLGAYEESGSTTFSSPGSLGAKIEERFGKEENVALADIITNDFDSAIDAIKEFFKKGR